MTLRFLIPLAVSATVISGSAQAQSSPGDIPSVTEGLIAAGMAIELGDFCDDVSVRMIRGLNFLHGLRRELRDAGFSEAEIEAYIDDDQEKDRLEVIARGRLADLGVVTSDRSTYCTVAQGQIAQATQVGRLLR